ncbi:MAG: 4'-phosphopantetheinyl transferase superfamily protein [Halioglobus sp.]
MQQSDSHRVKDFFIAHSRDVTPAPVRDQGHVLYVPVSNDPEITRCCASVLSATEISRAERFAIDGDRSLFIQRRAFRRFCAVQSQASSKPLSEIIFEETENGRPQLSEQPQFCFSFSSCRFGFLGGWSPTLGIGVDIEEQSSDPGAAELSRLYFSEAEAKAVQGLSGQINLEVFYQLWSLKEAALKSIGQGLPFGLNAFGFELEPSLRVVHTPSGYGEPNAFSAHSIDVAGSCAAVVLQSGPI